MPKLKSEKENAFPKPKKVKCFQCAKQFYIKFVLPRQEYSQKNNWDYWTSENSKMKSAKAKKICDSCLLNFYHDKPRYWSLVKDLRKRQQIRTYIYHGIIS